MRGTTNYFQALVEWSQDQKEIDADVDVFGLIAEYAGMMDTSDKVSILCIELKSVCNDRSMRAVYGGNIFRNRYIIDIYHKDYGAFKLYVGKEDDSLPFSITCMQFAKYYSRQVHDGVTRIPYSIFEGVMDRRYKWDMEIHMRLTGQGLRFF